MVSFMLSLEKNGRWRRTMLAREWAFFVSLMAMVMLAYQWMWGCSYRASCFGSVFKQPPISPSPTTQDTDLEAEASFLLHLIRMNGTSPCHHSRTHTADLLNLAPHHSKGLFYLHTDTLLTFTLASYAENGTARCSGGDYFETQLDGEHWKSRPPVKDHGNGSYSVTLFVDGGFEGLYNFTAYLLYDNFHGLDKEPSPWMLNKTVVEKQFVFVRSKDGGKKVKEKLPICKASDARRVKRWRGRWTRGWYNKTCEADNEGRFRLCLGEEHKKCEEGWCEGNVGRLESNGWVYAERCGFHIWEQEEAWECLNNKWIFLWGDSNLPDMLRNLLLFVLGYPPPTWANVTNWYIERLVEEYFVNPRKPYQSFHVSLIYSGHYDKKKSGLGLHSLHNHTYAEWLYRHFNGSTFPDLFILNAGLHDGIHFPTVDAFITALDEAVRFWNSVLSSVPAQKLPTLLLRTAVAPAGNGRAMRSNPQKMDVFNPFILERMRNLKVGDLLVMDAFDPSFPFHFDYSCSDGGHYGRPPKYGYWPWFGEPHQYFVELMLVHIMLNAVCN